MDGVQDHQRKHYSFAMLVESHSARGATSGHRRGAPLDVVLLLGNVTELFAEVLAEGIECNVDLGV